MALSDIDTIVVVILENRSFDHLLGYLNQPANPGQDQVEGVRTDQTWLTTHANMHAGSPYQSHRLGAQTQNIDDPQHDHRAIDVQITTPPTDPNLRSMGGFVESYVRFCYPTPPDPSLVMGYYDAEALPVFDFFATNFAVCDHWFAALPTGTQPNRLMAMSGECSIVDNASVFLPNQPLVYDWLTQNGVSWCAYQKGSYFPFFTLMPRLMPEILSSLTLSDFGVRGRFRRYSEFAEQWKSPSDMPSVIFIEPAYSEGPLSDPCDDHPPTGVAKGQAFLADLYGVLVGNRDRWAKTMMIVTYDEHGGFFDHVPPLPIPTTIAPASYQFQTTGVRVPAFVISPQVKPGSVFKGNLDHTSMLQLLADKFTPGTPYSVPVIARQGHLDRLVHVLIAPSATSPAPAISAAMLAEIDAAAGSPPPPPIGASPSDPPNSQALHKVAVRMATDHPDLLDQPGWAEVKGYLGGLSPTEPPTLQR